MISTLTMPTPYAARVRMPEGALACAAVLHVEDADRRVIGTRVSTGIALAARPDAFGVAGVRSWSPPV